MDEGTFILYGVISFIIAMVVSALYTLCLFRLGGFAQGKVMTDWRIRYVRTRHYGYQFRVESKRRLLFIPYWRGEGLHNTLYGAECHLYMLREREMKHPVGSVELTTTTVDGN